MLPILLLLACTTETQPESRTRPAQPGLQHNPALAHPAPQAQAAPPAAPSLPISDRLLPFGPEREQLTLAYRLEHQGPELAQSTRITPQMIVLHWTGGPTAESAWQTFAPDRLQDRPELQGGGALNVSAHYLVDQEGRVQRLLPDTTMARHTIGFNHVAIGVENVGDGAQWPLTPAQVQANVQLIRLLKAQHPGITHLIGHHEAEALRSSPLFLELDPSYKNSKADPGDTFMGQVRAQLTDLQLQSR